MTNKYHWFVHSTAFKVEVIKVNSETGMAKESVSINKEQAGMPPLEILQQLRRAVQEAIDVRLGLPAGKVCPDEPRMR